MFCSREIRDLATVQFTGFNHCELLDMIRNFYYWGIHIPEDSDDLQLIWRAKVDSALRAISVPIGSIVIETRDGSIKVISEPEYDDLYTGCC